MDIQLSDEGIVFKNSDIKVYKYRFAKIQMKCTFQGSM